MRRIVPVILVGLFAIGAGILLALFVKPIKRLMGEVN